MSQQKPKRKGSQIHKPPRGFKKKFLWLGPGVVWLAAGAGGAGELLFPPRVGSLYGYLFLWALILAVTFKWVINREIGRYAVNSGGSLIDGFTSLPGPRNWAIWLIIIPQLVVSVAAIAGLASAAATAVILFLPGSLLFWSGVILGSVALFLLLGKYALLEDVATVLAIILAMVGITAALWVFPDPADLVEGLLPRLPSDVDYQEIVPWLSFIMAGAAGMLWYSYWLPAKGYGAAGQFKKTGILRKQEQYTEEDVSRLRGWVNEMTIDNTLGVLGGTLIVTAFLILGAEVLRPEGVVPEERRVAEVLGKLLGNTWGRWGFWFMVIGVLVGFYNTTLTNTDGWSRLLGNGTHILLKSFGFKESAWLNAQGLRKIFILFVAGGAFGLFAWVGRPVILLQIAGIIEAFQIPLLGFLALYMNHALMPKGLRPTMTMTAVAIVSSLFYLFFACFFVLSKLGVVGNGGAQIDSYAS
ncbi:MAG: Nramp family divalent metal transporter [Syntrophotaleaceae bacterium]